MREAGVVSLNIRMVRECYQMMDLMEKQDFVFTQEDKRILLGYAFHQQDLDCVHDAVIHIAAVREKEKSKGNLEDYRAVCHPGRKRTAGENQRVYHTVRSSKYQSGNSKSVTCENSAG